MSCWEMQFYLHNEAFWGVITWCGVSTNCGVQHYPPPFQTQFKTECAQWNCPVHSWDTRTVPASLIRSSRCSLKVFFLQDFIYWYLFLVSNALLRYCIVVCIFTAHILCIKAWMSACLILPEFTGGICVLNVFMVQWYTNVGKMTNDFTGNKMEWQETVLFFCHYTALSSGVSNLTLSGPYRVAPQRPSTFLLTFDVSHLISMSETPSTKIYRGNQSSQPLMYVPRKNISLEQCYFKIILLKLTKIIVS